MSTTEDYLRFCQMLVNGGELDGVRILGRKTVELMGTNHLPGKGQLRDFAFAGGYGESGLRRHRLRPHDGRRARHGRDRADRLAGEFYWGGAASTIFWIDPVEDLVAVFMTQLMPSGTFNFRGQLKSLIYPAIVD